MHTVTLRYIGKETGVLLPGTTRRYTGAQALYVLTHNPGDWERVDAVRGATNKLAYGPEVQK